MRRKDRHEYKHSSHYSTIPPQKRNGGTGRKFFFIFCIFSLAFLMRMMKRKFKGTPHRRLG
ncbi:MAG TPA: hypothetical protein PLT09_07820 [Deltaproteobacteria bacterium]|nr:hypothetical protein [Deltaproteobacteria bacterium]HPR55718.1 hypothetical protein [Deltaproteobacteria bacterium]HXK47335.1 hypothetical protein [Deltaproteobacteria bacterium]